MGCLEHGVGHALPGRGLVQQNEKVKARPVMAQAFEQRVQAGGGLLQVFRTPDRQVEIRVLAAHEKSDVEGADLFANQRQQKDGLARIIAQHRDMGRSLRNVSDVIPPLLTSRNNAGSGCRWPLAVPIRATGAQPSRFGSGPLPGPAPQG